ncbi:MAG: polyphosphate kinase 1 [Actinomycetia bacterium]|nr:polyphosphate kinase 1 [Actinomycetes bacterium]
MADSKPKKRKALELVDATSTAAEISAESVDEKTLTEEEARRLREARNHYMLNREISWLKFNERVLEEAFDQKNPLLERLRYISIFGSNLDEFFMVRVGSLLDIQLMNPKLIDSKTGWTLDEQFDQIYKEVHPLYTLRDQAYEEVETELRKMGVYNLEMDELTEDDRAFIRKFYDSAIAPVLAPQVVDAHHPFPHLNNKKPYVVALIKHEDRTMLGLIPMPDDTPYTVFLPSGGETVRYVRLSRIISAFLAETFPNFEVVEDNVICVTRNADIDPAEEGYDVDEDIRYRMKRLLKRRKRLAPVRLECVKKPSDELEEYLITKLGISKDVVFYTKTPLVMNYLGGLIRHIPEQKAARMLYTPFDPVHTPKLKKGMTPMGYISKQDVLLSYPYESMDFFLDLIKEAADDPSVLSIRITIYRLSSKSKLVDYLSRAAENGKDVSVLLELRARFDEENNINWSEKLEDAGCTVSYGLDGYKVHSKLALITRRVGTELAYITHVGTGNFNETTAHVYTDLSLLTADEEIGRDAAEVFRNVGVNYTDAEYRRLWASPATMRTNIIKAIDEQIKLGEKGRIAIKINSLTDNELIDTLVRASQAGVKIDMIIRGISCMRPKVAGYTDNIRIISIIGRFLEHSRIYWFGQGKDSQVYLSSADFMTRNLDTRVEIAGPVDDTDLREKVRRILDLKLGEQTKRWEMEADGKYCLEPTSGEVIDSQKFLLEATGD